VPLADFGRVLVTDPRRPARQRTELAEHCRLLDEVDAERHEVAAAEQLPSELLLLILVESVCRLGSLNCS
jgi:hypothetical protein